MAKDKKYSSGDGYMYVYLLSIIACVVVALLVAFMVFGSSLFRKSGNNSTPPANDASSDFIGQTSGGDTSDNAIGTVSEPSRFTPAKIDNTYVNEGLLILVNQDNHYVFPEENERVSVYSVLGSLVQYRIIKGVDMNPTSVNALKSMCEGFYAKTGLTTGLLVNNAFKDGDSVDVPGASDYHTANTVQLKTYKAASPMGEGDFEWFLHNSYSYGFIQRYPEGKTAVTGEVANKEVYRYVGVCHAWYMYSNNLCLEEYLDLLKNYTPESPLIIDVQNKSYEVYYQPMQDGIKTEILLPAESAYLLSGNNSDGFIVTITG